MARRSVDDTGTLGNVLFADLLEHVEAGRRSGEVRFETPLGVGRIWFRDGSLIDAEMGDSTGEEAVFKLLGAADGAYTIEYKPVARLQVINETSLALLGRRTRRTSEWQRIVQQMPSLDTVLSLNTARFQAMRSKLPPVDAALLGLVDGRRNIVDIVDDSGFDAVAALERLAWYIRARLLRAAGSGSAPPPPVVAHEEPDTAADTRRRLNALARDVLSDDSLLPPRERGERTSSRPPRAGKSEAPSAGPSRRESERPSIPPVTEERRSDRPRSDRPPSDRPSSRSVGRDREEPSPPDQGALPVKEERPSVRPQAETPYQRAAGRGRLVHRETLKMAAVVPPEEARRGANEPHGEANPLRPAAQSEPPRASIVPAPTLPVGKNSPSGFGVAEPGKRSLSPSRTQIGLMPPELRAQTPASAHAAAGEAPAAGTPLLPPPRRAEPDTWPGASPPVPALPPAGEHPATLSEPPPPTELDAGPPPSGQRTVLGRYEILSRIARGGMGTVYLCRVTGEGGFRRLFALKVLRRHLSRDRAAADLFLQEARVASRIYDPHVVGIVDVGTYGAQPYLVMDYVEGASFHDLLQRHPSYRPPRLIVPIVLDALFGLHAAHTLTEEDGTPLSLVHCDVSPHNMLVGVDGTCRLSDFGIAKAAAAAASGKAISTRGKPAFLAPEQAAHRPMDHRGDLFSLGVVLWNALTGERLFDGATVEETVANVLAKPIPPPSKVGLKPPPCLDSICLKALARDPSDRYQSAEAMIHDLRAVALREDLLAPSSDVARWVTSTFGPELQARRLAALDASRRARAGGTVKALPEADRLSEPPPAPESNVSEPPPSSGPPSSDEHSRTVVLRPSPEDPVRKHHVLLGAAVVALVAIVLVLLFPDRVARLFKVESEAPLRSTTFTRGPVLRPPGGSVHPEPSSVQPRPSPSTAAPP